MAAVTTGKLIIRSIPDGKEREQIIDFLCSFAKGVAREAVAARLDTLPLTLSNAMPDDIGNNILISLQNMGADVIFVHGETNRPISQAETAAKTVQQPASVPVKEPETPAPEKTARPVSQNKAVKDIPVNHDIRVLVILLLVLVAGLCGASAICLPALKAASDPDLLLNKLLQKNADMNNKTCPRNLNPQLRLDGYVAGNKKMTINYTLLTASSTDVNGNDLRPSVSRNIREGLCNDKRAAELLKKDVAFVFAVHGNDGGLIFDYQVLNEDCDS
jgi:hypothetical protein